MPFHVEPPTFQAKIGPKTKKELFATMPKDRPEMKGMI